MNATFEELLSNVSTATKNGNALSQAYEKAIKAGLEDDQFRASTNQILSILEEVTMEAAHAKEMESKLRHQCTKTHPNFIRDVLTAEDLAKSAVRKSTTAKERMETAVGSAANRKKARDDDAVPLETQKAKDDAGLETKKAGEEKSGAVGSSNA